MPPSWSQKQELDQVTLIGIWSQILKCVRCIFQLFQNDTASNLPNFYHHLLVTLVTLPPRKMHGNWFDPALQFPVHPDSHGHGTGAINGLLSCFTYHNALGLAGSVRLSWSFVSTPEAFSLVDSLGSQPTKKENWLGGSHDCMWPDWVPLAFSEMDAAVYFGLTWQRDMVQVAGAVSKFQVEARKIIERIG